MKNSLLQAVATAAMALCVAGAAALEPTYTVPVIYVNTDGSQAITSKEDYLPATYYIDPCETEFEAVGSKDAPLATGIKGRGNYTWVGFDKKPYKLKLDKKTVLLGMDKNKHYALLAHADDNRAFLRNTVGFEMSRRMGLPWTPAQQPVELVLNGEYEGLYFLTQTIRIDPTRVDITEQPDQATDPAEITGGWLVEIDNYDKDPHVTIMEESAGSDPRPIWFTYKSPEILSSVQEAFLTEHMQALNDAIYAETKTDPTALEGLLDLQSAAQFYLVQEVMDNCESFHGSCYLWRDRGEDAKWHFGPVWDFGNAFQRNKGELTIYQGQLFWQVWIGELCKWPAFQDAMKTAWAEFCENHYEGLYDYIDNFINYITPAAARDLERWPQYGNSDLQVKKDLTIKNIQENISLVSRWEGVGPKPEPEAVYLRGSLNNWGLDNRLAYKGDGLYTLEMPLLNGEFKIASENWSTVDYGAPRDNDPLVSLGQPYTLYAQGANMKLAASEVANVTVNFDITTATLLIKDSQGVEYNVVPAAYTLTGRSLQAHSTVLVHNTAGALVSRLAAGQEVTLTPGIYVVSGEKVEKVVIR